MENSTGPNCQPSNATKKREFKKVHKHSAIGLSLIIFLCCFFLGSGLLVYRFGNNHSYINKMVEMLPYPAAVVNLDLVRLSNFYEEVEALQALVVKQQGQLTDEVDEKIKSDVLDKLIHDKIIKQLAKKFDVKLSWEDIEKEKEKLIEEAGGNKDEIDKKIQDTWGWDFDTFFEKVVLSSVYQQKIRDKFYENENRKKTVEKQAKEVLDLMKKGDESFQDLAKKYSQDPRFARFGGEWGWVSRGILPIEVEEAAFSMEKGDISDLILTRQGYHIIMIDNKRGENTEQEVWFYDIFFKFEDFEEYLRDYLADSRVYKFVK